MFTRPDENLKNKNRCWILNLVIVSSDKLYFHSLHKRFQCTANNHSELNFCYKFYLFIQVCECMGKVFESSIPPFPFHLSPSALHIGVSKSNLSISQSSLSILQSLTHTVNLSVWLLVEAISITSFFSFWKLDYIFDMNCLKKTLSDMISLFFLNSTNRFRFFSVILTEIQILTHWTLTAIGEILTKCCMCVIWESH